MKEKCELRRRGTIQKCVCCSALLEEEKPALFSLSFFPFGPEVTSNVRSDSDLIKMHTVDVKEKRELNEQWRLSLLCLLMIPLCFFVLSAVS